MATFVKTNNKEISDAAFVEATSYSDACIRIECTNPKIAELIKAHLITDATECITHGDTLMAEELMHVYNNLSLALDLMERKTGGEADE